MAQKIYDLAIIGAGPAGATLARLAGNDLNILLVDRRSIDASGSMNQPTKCCGGLLAPDAQAMLARLGLGLPKQVLVGPQLFVVRTIDLQPQREVYYQRHYLNIDRARFDAWLVSLVPPNVDLRLQTVFKGFERNVAGFTLHLTANNQKYQEQARILVGADGAFSAIRRLAFPEKPCPRSYIAIQELFHCHNPLPYYSAVFDPEISDFYGWTIPKEEHLLVGIALDPGNESLKMFKLFKEKLRPFGFELSAAPIHRDGAWVLRPQRGSQLIAADKGIALLGEAGGWISPSSAEGLSYAFQTAMSLYESLIPGLTGFERRYEHLTGPLKRVIQLKNLKSPFMYQPQIRGLMMRTGLNRLPVREDK